MPASQGNFSAPAVRSPLGQDAPLGVAPLLPSPEITRTGRSSSPSESANPFSFQPPDLETDESTLTDNEAAAREENRGEYSLRNSFYHPSDSAAEASLHDIAIYQHTNIGTTDPADIPAASFAPISSPSPLFAANDASGSEDLTEFDTEGYSALEKIYLFSRSRVGFHRVFITKSLGMFLQEEVGSIGSSSSSETTQEGEGQDSAPVDTISPDDAVQYVLPLLNGLAMDEGKVHSTCTSDISLTLWVWCHILDEAVKEALASELVPIIWWFVTRCKLVDEDVALGDYTQDDEDEALSLPETPDSMQNIVQGPPTSLPIEALRTDSDPVLHMSPEPLHRSTSSPDPGARHATHHNSLTALTHSSPSTSPHASVTSLHPFPPPQAHTPDHPSPLSHTVFSSAAEAEAAIGGPALISVQSFTPILGTLLLSPNTHVGGPARYAVVELLRRVRKADDFEHNTITQLPADPTIHPLDEGGDDERYSDVGLFGEEQRRLFEREMIHQVVIGMGKLDLPEDQLVEVESTSGSGFTTAVGTPLNGQAVHPVHRSSPGLGDSYFPPVSPPSSEYQSESGTSHYGAPRLSPVAMYPSSSAQSLAISMPPPITSFADFAASGLLSPPLEMTPSPSMSMSASPFGPSPFMSPSLMPSAASSMSTSALVSGSSASVISPPSALRTPSTPGPSSSLPVPLNLNLAPQPPSSSFSDSHSGSFNITASVSATPGSGTWIPPRSPGDLPFGSEEERQRFGSGLEVGSGVPTHVANWAGENGVDEGDLGEEAAIGRLSSMSLMAAVTASGKYFFVHS